MLSEEEEREIQEGSYIPEHNYLYVSIISELEPKFIRPFVTYEGPRRSVVVGYPISGEFDEKKMKEIVSYLRGSKDVSVICPFKISDLPLSASDFYYRLEVKDLRVSQKTRNMIRRAEKEVSVEIRRGIEREHMEIVEEFIKGKSIEERTAWILRRIDSYISSSPKAFVIDSRDKSGRLVAFNVVDLFSRDYAFFMFSIRRGKGFVPGTADLLFYEMVELARKEGKKYLNLGLGINDGIRFFKEKWGGKPFLAYNLYEKRKPSFLLLLDRLLGQ